MLLSGSDLATDQAYIYVAVWFLVVNIGHVSPLFIGFSGHGKVGVGGVWGGEHRAKVYPF